MRNTCLEVDVKLFNKNVDSIQKYVGNKEIMPVIKANAYGTYINKNIEIIDRFSIVGVAIVDEGVELRQNGFKKDIFVLNQPSIDEIDNIVNNDIIIGLSDISFLEEVLRLNINLRVHLEIETGMNRTGIKLEDINSFLNKIGDNNRIIVEGIYTHLSSADCDSDYTLYQLDRFKNAVDIIKEKIPTIKYIHSCASNGLINYNDDISNLVRPGLILYGYDSFLGAGDKINIFPVCKLKTKITFLKNVDKGESIGYSRKYIAKENMVVGTIPIGYADGLRREYSNKGYVYINGKMAKIVGNICMDSCMIDVGGIDNVSVDDDVYIFDNINITLEDIARECNTINYEILSTISYRVPRKYINV